MQAKTGIKVSENTVIYGIKNCDTVRKTLQWFDNKGICYHFHDYKKQGIDHIALEKAIKTEGWEAVINKRGTTWKKLPDDIKSTMNAQNAAKIAEETPSIVKRPMIVRGNRVILGFDEDILTKFFSE